jgi:drug/metabolite transporter (DMT)-like permease
MALHLVALLTLWNAVDGTVQTMRHSNETSDFQELDSHAEELLVRRGTSRPAQQSEPTFNWVALLSSFVKEHPKRDTGLSEYLVGSSHVGELAPSDFAAFTSKTVSAGGEHNEPAVLDAGVAQAIYFSGLVVMGALVCWMYFERGTRVVLAVLCYMFSLSSMTLTIRNVYVNFNFHYPVWLTASHFLFTALIGLCILFHQHKQVGTPISVPPLSQFVKGIFPVSLVFAISIGSANLGLLYTNAHFYEMVGATTALATAGLGACLGRPFNRALVPPVLLVTLGLMTCAFGEIVFSAVGFTFCAMAVITRALKSIVQHQLLDGSIGSQLTPIQLVVWMSLPSFAIMAIWSLYTEGTQPFYDFYLNVGTQGAVLLTVVNACILNTAALYVLQNLGPVAQQLAGQLKGVLSVLGSVALFSEQVTVQQIIGYSIIIGGVTWYNRRDMWLKQQSAQEPQVGTTNSSGIPTSTTKAGETSPLVAHSGR